MIQVHDSIDSNRKFTISLAKLETDKSLKDMPGACGWSRIQESTVASDPYFQTVRFLGGRSRILTESANLLVGILDPRG